MTIPAAQTTARPSWPWLPSSPLTESPGYQPSVADAGRAGRSLTRRLAAGAHDAQAEDKDDDHGLQQAAGNGAHGAASGGGDAAHEHEGGRPAGCREPRVSVVGADGDDDEGDLEALQEHPFEGEQEGRPVDPGPARLGV